MSQKVNAVPDGAFSVPPLTTTAGSRVSRRRIKVPANYPGTRYSHNGQSALPSVVTFDIADNESFLDVEKSLIVLDFLPTIYHYAAAAQDINAVNFDGSSQSLMARVRIGNSQGLIIEELQAYGTWANIMENYSESVNQVEHHLLDSTSTQNSYLPYNQNYGSSTVPVNFQDRKVKRLFLRFKHSSFLKSCKMIPLFLMRNGIRFEIEFEDVMKCFTRHVQPRWKGPVYANRSAHDITLSTGPSNLEIVQNFDYFFIQESANRELNLIVKKNGHLAKELNLQRILLDNINMTFPASDVVSSVATVTNLKWTGAHAMPLKFEYADELGTQKVLLQGMFEITGLAVSRVNQSAGVVGDKFATSDNLKLLLLSELTNDAGLNLGQTRDALDEYAFVLRFTPAYEGFVNPFLNSVGSVTPFVPYWRSLRCYYTNEVVPTIGFANTGLPNASATVNTISGAGAAVGVTKTWNEETQHWNQPIYSSYSISKATWNYSAGNIEMMCDFVKPSSEVFLQFQQSFQSPSGIPYAYKRVLYHTRVISAPDGLQQISLPVSVRSLRGIVCVISDKLAWSRSTDNSSKSFNSLSAFMKRGLTRAQLVIGGQNYPSYDLNLTENGVEQIPELECLFNVAGLGSFNPSFDKKELLSSRNYAIGAGYGASGVAPFDGVWTPSATVLGQQHTIQEYQDTSKFVLGISTMKKDGDFVTGVDTSQAGSVSLNLFFKRQRDVANMQPGDMGGNRDVFIQVWSIADAVFTLQNDANLVRY